jgi:hypothetical protein
MGDFKPYLLTDPNYAGGQKILITNTDTHTIFELLKARFEKGELYKTKVSVEPFLWVQQISRTNFGPFTEIRLEQLSSDVSVHMLHYYNQPLKYSDLYISLTKYIFSELQREIPSEILEQLGFKRFAEVEKGATKGSLIFLLIGIIVVAGAMLNNGATLGIVFLLPVVAIILYYLWGLREKGFDSEPLLRHR